MNDLSTVHDKAKVPSFAGMVKIWELRARGMNAEAIAAHLGLAVEDVQIVLNPPPKATP